MKRFSGLLFILLLLAACDGDADQADQRRETTAPTPPTPPTPSTEVYPSLTSAIMENLWNNCDYIDFSFYYTDFSMNQDEQNSIRTTLRHVASEVPQIQANCQPIGHIFYQNQGKILLDADIFFSEGCTYFIFYENGKKAYANEMTPGGVKFYQDLFARVQSGG